MVICCSRLLLTKICSSLGMPGAEGSLGGRAALIIMQSCEPHHCSSLLPTGLGLQSTYQVLDIKTLVSFSVFHKDQPWFNRSQGKILRSETFRSLNLAPKTRTPWRRMWSLRSAWLCPPSLLPFEPSPQCGIAHQGFISLILFLNSSAGHPVFPHSHSSLLTSPLPYARAIFIK